MAEFKKWGNKRYNAFNFHLREYFGEKIIKVSLDGGFTCPNRDGKISTSGCIFCSPKGSGDFAGDRKYSIEEQFIQVRERTKLKWPKAKYIAYFQSFSGTYASAEYLRKLYNQALAINDIVGLSVSTRPDCLNAEVLDVLEEMSNRTYLWVELGLQSVHDSTLDWLNRGHDYACFLEALDKLRSRNIRVCVHIILGLPCESRNQMIETAKEISKQDIQGIKLHSLHVLRGTPLAELMNNNDLELMALGEYIKLVTDILELLSPNIIIQRLMGDGPLEQVIAPKWTRKKWEVINGIEGELENRDTWQGKNYGVS